jgi:calcineurin-like phosphoesterase family protein
MKTFVSSDLHLGHLQIQEYEPPRNTLGDDVSAMNESIIAAWNDTVAPEDFVFFLGDLAMGKIAESLPLAKRLNGRKWLVTGNHDRTFSHKPKNLLRWRPAYHEVGFEAIVDELDFVWEDTPIRMCHFPYDGDHTDEGDRHPERRPDDDGTILLCGHMHGEWLTERSKKGSVMVNVGIDAINKYTDSGFRPILLSDAIALAKTAS